MEIYQPKDTVTEVELYERLLEVKMKPKEDQKTIFEQFASITNWYNSSAKKVPLEQQIAVILKAAPKEYASVLTSEQKAKGTTLKVSHLRAVMSQYYRAVHKKKGSKGDDDDDEMALASTNEKGQSNSQKKSSCNNGGKAKFNGDCNLCGKHGHKSTDCWENPKNADSRPKWWKPKNEVNAAAKDTKKSDELQIVNISWGKYAEEFEEEEVDYKQALEEVHNGNVDLEKTDTEVLLRMAVENIQVNATILDDPEVWIVDTGATCHSTGHSDGLVDAKDVGGKRTKVGNGARVASKSIGSLPFEAVNNGVKGTMG